MSYNDKEIAFINDLRDALKKHSVELYSLNEYGEFGQYIGTHFIISDKEANIWVVLDDELLKELKSPN